MDEADQCDRVALIQDGKILKISTPSEVAQSFSAPLFGIKSKSRFRLIQALKEFEHTKSVHPFGESVHYADQREHPDVDEIEKYLQSRGIENLSIRKINAGIEDTFMELMEKEGSLG